MNIEIYFLSDSKVIIYSTELSLPLTYKILNFISVAAGKTKSGRDETLLKNGLTQKIHTTFWLMIR